MHDVFTATDLVDDTQHRMLAHWLVVRARSVDVPLAAFDFDHLPVAIDRRFVTFDLSAGDIRHARILSAGDRVIKGIGIDPTGRVLEELLPAEYLSDLIPAYALCAGLFLPVTTLDEITYADGHRRLVRRLVLPASRRAHGADGTHRAGHLIMIYNNFDEEGTEPTADGACRTMQRIHSHSVSLFKDGSGCL